MPLMNYDLFVCSITQYSIQFVSIRSNRNHFKQIIFIANKTKNFNGLTVCANKTFRQINYMTTECIWSVGFTLFICRSTSIDNIFRPRMLCGSKVLFVFGGRPMKIGAICVLSKQSFGFRSREFYTWNNSRWLRL